MMTLPMIARADGISLDGLRHFIRGRAELRALGRRLGPARVYTATEVRRIREAWERRTAAAAK